MTSNSSENGAVEWNPNTNPRFREEWEKRMEQWEDGSAPTSGQTDEPEETSMKIRKSISGFSHGELPSSEKNQSLLGWVAQKERQASIVMSFKEDDQNTVLGWAVDKNGHTERIEENEENVDVFITQSKDILDIRVQEVSLVAKRVVHSDSLQKSINELSVRRPVVAILFADFYANVLLVAEFINATDDFLKSENGQAGADVFLLLGLVGYFAFREILQFSAQGVEYLRDPFNLLDIARIVLTAISTFQLRGGNISQEGAEPLLIASGATIFVGMISFLRSSFKPFANFVHGTRKIIIALLPFFVITTVVLFAFAYVYWVDGFEFPGESDLIDGFFTAYTLFLSGPEEVTNLLDVLAGLVLVVLLLNVVIAIVTKAWDETSAAADEVFWIHRIGFLIELRVFVNFFHDFRKARDGKLAVDHIGADIEERLSKVGQEWDGVLPVGSRIKLSVHFVCLWSFYFGMILLGLITFGYYWPLTVRERVFGDNHTSCAELHRQEREKSIWQEIQVLKKSTQPLQAELNEIKKGMEEIRQLLLDQNTDKMGKLTRRKTPAKQTSDSSLRRPSEGLEKSMQVP